MTDKRITDKDKYELTIEETSFVEDVRNIISTAKEHTYKTANLMIVVSNCAENGGYPPTQNGDIRSLFWLFSLMALQN